MRLQKIQSGAESPALRDAGANYLGAVVFGDFVLCGYFDPADELEPSHVGSYGFLGSKRGVVE